MQTGRSFHADDELVRSALDAGSAHLRSGFAIDYRHELQETRT
jgi:hypothetical protein